MALEVIPATESFVYTDETPSPLDRVITIEPDAHLGFGLLRPFRRDEKSDFASAGGVKLVKACIGQILGMQGSTAVVNGELEWDPERGAQIFLIRHSANDFVAQQMARVYVTDALRKWEPRIRVKKVEASRSRGGPDGDEVILNVRLVFDVLSTNSKSNQVLYENVNQTLSLAI